VDGFHGPRLLLSHRGRLEKTLTKKRKGGKNVIHVVIMNIVQAIMVLTNAQVTSQEIT